MSRGATAVTMETIDACIAAIRQCTSFEPEVGMILGTGLGGALVGDLELEAVVGYDELPDFPVCTVDSHAGRFLLGRLAGRRVVAMQGRFHHYEGYTLQQVTLPVRVMAGLGARTLIATGASGGMNPFYSAGDVVLLEDHINLMGDNPLIGPNLDELGPRFPDMSEPYDKGLRELAERVALDLAIPLRQGVYVAVTGPNLETRAEYRMLRAIGADVVGMSTVPEVIVARHMGLRVLALSIVTDLCFPDALQPTDIQEIIRTANEAEPKLTALILGVLERLETI